MRDKNGEQPGRTMPPGASDAGGKAGSATAPAVRDAKPSTAFPSETARGNLQGTPVQTSNVSPPAVSVTGTGTARSGVGQAQSVAQQMGQLLTAGRGGEAELSRVVMSSSASAEGRSATSGQGESGRSSSARQSLGQPSTAQSEKADGLQRSSFDQLVRSIRLQTGLRNSSARLQLEPPELGRIRVDVRMTGDQLEINIRTETEAATERLNHRASALKAALEHHGIHVDRFDVTTEPSGRELNTDGDAHGSEAASGFERGYSRGESDSSDSVPSDDSEGSAGSEDVFTVAAVGETRLDVKA